MHAGGGVKAVGKFLKVGPSVAVRVLGRTIFAAQRMAGLPLGPCERAVVAEVLAGQIAAGKCERVLAVLDGRGIPVRIRGLRIGSTGERGRVHRNPNGAQVRNPGKGISPGCTGGRGQDVIRKRVTV